MISVNVSVGERTFGLLLSRYIQKLYYFGPNGVEKEWGRPFVEMENAARKKFSSSSKDPLRTPDTDDLLDPDYDAIAEYLRRYRG